MASQDELDIRTAKLTQLCSDIKILLPSLIGRSLNILSMDISLMNQQINIISSRLPDLDPEDYRLGLKIILGYQRNYPKKKVSPATRFSRRIVPHRTISPPAFPPKPSCPLFSPKKRK